MRAAARSLLLAAACLASTACIPSNVVAPEARDVTFSPEKELGWRPADRADLAGFYESTRIEGASAGALLRAYYYFDTTGSYSGAALVIGEDGPRFLVIADDGQWMLSDGRLDLGDGSGELTAEVAPEHLRLVSPESVIVFRQLPLE